MQLIFNKIAETKEALYKESEMTLPGEESVTREQIRTFRILFTQKEKNQRLQTIVNTALKAAMLEIETYS